MLNRGAFRIISLALVLALFGAAATYSADAQDPPRPPEPKRPPQQQDAREKKGSRVKARKPMNWERKAKIGSRLTPTWLTST